MEGHMARKTYKIEVTPLDIEKAIQNDSYQCMVAQAVRRTIPEATRIMVDMRTIRFSLEGCRLQYLTPTDVAQYVVDFDAGDAIEPFKFGLRKPHVTRPGKARVDPQAKPAKVGSPEARARAGKRHPRGATLPLVGAKGKVTHEPVLPAHRTLPSMRAGKVRHYGARMLRINRDRFKDVIAS
jgi:hypothetical protein